MTKAELIRKITQWNGRTQMATPVAELKKWSKDELEATWREMVRAGK